jgi:starch-binding outer membrane protein, SusD/RagB family
MKKLTYIGVIALLLFTSISCTDDEFLNRAPLDAISEADFWSTPNDLQLYVNQFYTMLPEFPGWGGGYLWDDNNSDNMHHSTYNTRLAGLLSITAGNSGWNYARLRSINIMLDQYEKVTGPKSDIDAMVGEAYFFRAYFYFGLLKNYGDVPWIEKPLTPDSEELFAPRSSRSVVVDNLLADLDKAVTLLRPRSTATGNRINKEAALVFKSRVALYEGTWQKYHSGTPFGTQGGAATKYLQAAADAAKQLIDMNTASIYNTGKPDTDYGKLFNSDDLTGITEAILWRRYSVALNMTHNMQRYIPLSGGGTGLTKSLVESYLCTDGQPISLSPLYQGDKSLQAVVANRDGRLKQTIWIPGDPTEIVGGQVVKAFEKPRIDGGGEDRNTTGYQLKKGADPTSPGIQTPGTGITALVIFRYAEALLNYAEAKAELGTLTQPDVDMTINKLRKRAGLPDLSLSSIANDPKWEFPSLSPVINEVRRERRVEFACEGYRFDDLARWRAHHLVVGKRPVGAWFDQSLFPNMVIGSTILLDGEGYIDYLKNSLPNGWGFKPERDYLLPVPPDQITLNDKLTQNPGWQQ